MKSKFLFIFMLLILVLGIASVSAADIDANPEISTPCDVAVDGFGYASNDGIVANDSVNSPLLRGG